MSRAAEAAMAATYKSLKEDFVSNLTGGEIQEINYVTAVAPVSSNTRNLSSSNLRIGSSNCLVCVTIAALVLQTLQPPSVRSGFPPQCWSHPSRNDSVLRHAPPPQHPLACTCCNHICRPSSSGTDESEDSTIETNERQSPESPPKEVLLDHISRGYVGCYMSGYTGS